MWNTEMISKMTEEETFAKVENIPVRFTVLLDFIFSFCKITDNYRFSENWILNKSVERDKYCLK